jgi:hypothetical protein
MGDLLLGCSGWNYGHTPENGGGWTEFSIPMPTLKGCAIIPIFLTQQK